MKEMTSAAIPPAHLIPTLTEIVDSEPVKEAVIEYASLPVLNDEVAVDALQEQSAVVEPDQPLSQPEKTLVLSSEERAELIEALTNRVMLRVEALLAERVAQALEQTIEQQTLLFLPRLREQLSMVVNEAACEAVALELADSLRTEKHSLATAESFSVTDR